MTRYEIRQARQSAAFYAEDRSAIRWPYYFHLVFWGIVLAWGVAEAAITGNPDWSVPIGPGFFGMVFAATFALKNWPMRDH